MYTVKNIEPDTFYKLIIKKNDISVVTSRMIKNNTASYIVSFKRMQNGLESTDKCFVISFYVLFICKNSAQS